MAMRVLPMTLRLKLRDWWSAALGTIPLAVLDPVRSSYVRAPKGSLRRKVLRLLLGVLRYRRPDRTLRFISPADNANKKRFALPHSRIMMHQPSGGFSGQATDIEIHAKEILSLRARLNDIYVKHTGQKLSFIEKNMERDKFLSPEEAKDFGIIDEVVESRPLPEDGAEKSD